MEWRNVVGYEGHYQVSDRGAVRSIKGGKTYSMNSFLSEKGYPRITLTKNGKMRQVFVHRLVVEAFIGKIPEGKLVNHIDGDKANNSITNLEIITQSENVLHSCYKLGNLVRPVLMLDPNDYTVVEEYQSMAKAARAQNIDDAAIYKVCTGERNFAGGYSWVFKDDHNENTIKEKRQRLKEKYKSRKLIQQIDPKTLEVIALFEGAREAMKATGIKTIIHCATGRTKTAGGYIWRYK